MTFLDLLRGSFFHINVASDRGSAGGFHFNRMELAGSFMELGSCCLWASAPTLQGVLGARFAQGPKGTKKNFFLPLERCGRQKASRLTAKFHWRSLRL